MFRYFALPVIAVAFFSIGTTGANAETRVQKTFGSWLVSCVQVDDGANNCKLSQTFQLQPSNGGQANFAFSWIIGTGEDGVHRAVLRTPTNVNLEKDISVGLEGEVKTIVNFRQCTGNVCLGVTDFAEKWAETFIQQNEIQVIYTLLNMGQVNITVDLAGFGDAYAYFTEAQGQ